MTDREKVLNIIGYAPTLARGIFLSPRISAAILDALAAHGWAVVPREPTPEMVRVGVQDARADDLEPTDAEIAAIYRAMIAAGNVAKGEA